MIPTLHNMAHIFWQNQQIEEAVKSFSEALQLALETQNALGMYNVSRDLGHLLCQLGDTEHGLPLLRQAVQVGRAMGAPDVEEVEALLRRFAGK
ncbi:MAG: tetratricopeptide repeat protein [candidate division KSB1 bacterium]|nr:tetratricopeptide repeat protein [candidate division KSB1 bacterium]